VELSDAARKRHMTRNFTGAPLDRAVVDDLLELAFTAPSAGNTQGRDFVVLEGPEETARYWDATTDAAWRERSLRFAGLSRAPVVVLAFSDPDAYEQRYREPDKVRADGTDVDWVVPFWHVDAAFAVQTLLLAAADRGVGAAFLGNFRGEDGLKQVLGVPATLRWLGSVLLGEPARPDPPSTSADRPRRTATETVHRGRW
jgi:nitroreductase